MKLVDLNPRMAISRALAGGSWSEAAKRNVGMTLDCPCCRATRLMVHFRNPIGGTAPEPVERLWDRTGDSFDTMTLSPSIDASAVGHAHFSIAQGLILFAGHGL